MSANETQPHDVNPASQTTSGQQGGHSCPKCVDGNPFAEYPDTLAFARYENSLALHSLLWAIADAMHLERTVEWVTAHLPKARP